MSPARAAAHVTHTPQCIAIDKQASNRCWPLHRSWLKERMLARRLLLSTDGPYDNVIKIKPPMVFGHAEAHRLLAELE